MKKPGIILAVLLILIGLALFGLQLFLTNGLTTALNQGAFPYIKETYGLDMNLTGASVNLLTGSANLEGLSVRNPGGYEEKNLLTVERCRVKVGLLSLIRHSPILIQLAEIQGAVLTVERNRENNINLREVAATLQPEEPASEKAPPDVVPQPQPGEPKQPPAPVAPEAKPAAPPVPVHLRRIAVDARIKYADSRLQREYDLDLELTANNLFTIPAEGQPDSLVTLRGSLFHDKNAFLTDLSLIFSPPTDPEQLTFNATGSVLDIAAELLGDFLRKNKMDSSSFSIKPSITCKKGRLDGSKVDLVLNDLTLYGAEIGDTTLPLALRGTLQAPFLDITSAIQAVASEQSVAIGRAIARQEMEKKLKEKRPDGVATNQPVGEAAGDMLFNELEKNVKELKGNEALRDSLRNLGTSLLGK